MTKKSLLLSAAGLLAVGAISSIAVQSFAQTAQPVPQVQTAATVSPVKTDTPDSISNDKETNDDQKVTGSTTTSNSQSETKDMGDGDGENLNQ